MRKLFLLFIILATVGIFAAVTFAGSRPDYKCQQAASRCEKHCDEQAEKSRNSNAYNRCLEGCRESQQNCEKRQEGTNICADAFQRCLRNAGSDQQAKEGCRSSYRRCKGHN